MRSVELLSITAKMVHLQLLTLAAPAGKVERLLEHVPEVSSRLHLGEGIKNPEVGEQLVGGDVNRGHGLAPGCGEGRNLLSKHVNWRSCGDALEGERGGVVWGGGVRT